MNTLKDQLVDCDGLCGNKFKKKQLKRLPSGWFCDVCYRKKREEHREYLKRDILGIRKRADLLKEWEQKRNQRMFLPKIKGSKDQAINKRTNPFKGIWLTKLEKYIIFKKYRHLGEDFARNKLEEINNTFEKMIDKWREEKKTNEEININFKEEFAKLIMQNGQ